MIQVKIPMDDGTPDYLDTDSDGDGCSDAKESGYTDADE